MATTRTEIEQLAELLDSGVPTDATSELATMALLAETLRESTSLPTPDPAFRAQLRRDLLAAPAVVPFTQRVRDSIDARTAKLRYSLRAGMATGAAASLLGTAGVAAAAQEALPGELLYPVKTGTENARLLLASGNLSEGRVHLDLARERLTEVDRGARDLADQLLVDTIDRMDDSATSGAEDLLNHFLATGAAEVIDELRAFTAEQTASIDDLIDELPSAVRPAAIDSMELLRRIDVRIDEVTSPCGDCGESPVTAPIATDGPLIASPGEGPALAVDVPCRCSEPTLPPPPRDDEVVVDDPQDEPSEPAVEESPEPTPDPTQEPVSEDDLLPNLPGPIEDVVDPVEDIVDDLIDQLPDPVQTPVEDVLDTVDDLVDPVNDALEDAIGTGDGGTPVDAGLDTLPAVDPRPARSQRAATNDREPTSTSPMATTPDADVAQTTAPALAARDLPTDTASALQL